MRGTRRDRISIEFYEPEFEQMSRDKIRALQLKLFKEDFARAWSGNPFYRTRYDAARVRPDDIKTLEDLHKVPVVRKDDVVRDIAAQPPYGTRLQVPTSEIVNVVETSNTTGRGTEVQCLTASDWDRIVRAEAFGFFWAGARKGTVVAMNTPVTMTAAGTWWFGALERLQSNFLRMGSADTEERLAIMKRYSPEIMTASAAYLLRLEYVAEQLGYDLQRDFPRLKSIFCGGGGWTVQWAQERAEKWGATLFEQYGNSQRAIAWTCEYGIVHGSERGIVHSLPHLSLLEVVDRETGRHVAPGEEGELVVTAFAQEGTPIIRYATDDRVRFMPADACRCGRPFDGIEAGTVSRYDDMMKIKGLNVWPDVITHAVFRYAEAAEYRGDVFVDDKGMEVARVQVEFRPDIATDRRDSVLKDINDEIHKRTGLNFLVQAWSGPSLLAAGAGGFNARTLKIKRWTDRRRDTLNRQMSVAEER